ncbi:ATP-binding cassette domain-containing protein [Xinfangfangia sp. D13-10-4-6]|uniref:methionine ABC transporter ATP-binding protein n=1 Tax=Pseudogemmobacter hezensis TaxID=2737662 RepID=UPI001555F183|nr:ATP-binding cassette domain-containing protein [Pseudogemmobacter hezensis]NPD13813.1 ATP-binding cassette domain-containing protein [Pseudogemmobacter hezensis]
MAETDHQMDAGTGAATGADRPVVQLENVTRRFSDRPALDDISLQLGRGEIVGLIGRSGAGKSTLIRCLNGLDRPQGGRVVIDGTDISQLSEQALNPVRRRIGMIFQHFNLLSAKTVADNVALPLKIAGMPRPERMRRVMELLDLVGLADKAAAYPAQLSGGQKQRIGIARALAPKPLLLLSDEATSALDPETTQSILALLKDVNRQLDVTILMITHEMEVVRQIAHRVLVLDAGRIVEEGPVARVLASPQTETTRSLLRGLSPVLPGDLLALIRPQPGQGDQALIRVDVYGPDARRPLLAQIEAITGHPARLLHGGLNDVQGEPYGRLFLGLGSSDPAHVAAVAAQLKPQTTAIEVLGYVPANV